MRLTPDELTAVRQTLLETDREARLWLFGSRADDTRRGGDIDLHLEPSRPLSLKASLLLEFRLQTLCGAKVDLVVRNPGQPELPIHRIARQGVRL
jgi:predicted nucleotidyltransferase